VQAHEAGARAHVLDGAVGVVAEVKAREALSYLVGDVALVAVDLVELVAEDVCVLGLMEYDTTGPQRGDGV